MTIRRGTVENMIKANPFRGNAIHVAGLRNDAYEKRYEDQMKRGEEFAAKLETQRQAAQDAQNAKNAEEYRLNNPPPAPNYQRGVRRKKTLASLRTMSV